MSRVSTIKMTARQFLELGEDPPGVRAGKYVGRTRGAGSDFVMLSPFAKLQILLAKLWRPK